MAVVPQFGPGRPVAVRPIDSSGNSKPSLPTWVWYAGGAVVAIIVLLFLRGRSSSSASGSPLQTTATDQSGQIANLEEALKLASQGVDSNGIHLQSSQFMGTDSLIYNKDSFWSVGGQIYPKWQFQSPPSAGSPGAVPAGSYYQ